MEETEEENESKENIKERPQSLLTRKQKKAKKVIWRIRLRNRHNGQNLRSDYFTAKWPSVVPDLHVLGKLKIDRVFIYMS